MSDLTQALGGRPSDEVVAQLESSIERFAGNTAFEEAQPAAVDWVARVGKQAQELRSTLEQGDVLELTFIDLAPLDALAAVVTPLKALEREALRMARLCKRKPRRPEQHAREVLAYDVAVTLSGAGVRLSTTETGRLAGALRVVLHAAGAKNPENLRPLLRRVVPRARRSHSAR